MLDVKPHLTVNKASISDLSNFSAQINMKHPLVLHDI